MQTNTTPKVNPEKLLDIIRGAYEGRVVIPEFQRSFVWGCEDIEDLLVSIMQGYFIGTFLMLDTPENNPPFPFRKVEGWDHVQQNCQTNLNHSTVRLVLDGQQRITSLFYVLYEPPIPLRNAKNPYRFYFCLEEALQGNVEGAVRGVSQGDRKEMAEMENRVREGRAIRFTLMRDSKEFYKWLYNSQQFLNREEDKEQIESFYRRFADFMVPVVALSHDTSRDNIVNTFERINRTGVALSLFDLAVARLYLKGIKLRDMWDEFAKANESVAKVIKPEFVLKVIALWEGKEPKKGTLLDIIDALDTKQFNRYWEDATQFILQAYKRITAPQGGYGVFKHDLIPYSTLIVPLAVLLYTVERQNGGEAMYRKVDSWYWASVFTQRYDSSVDTKTFQDIKEMTHWMEGGNPPTWLTNLSADTLDIDVDKPHSALYRGLMGLIVLAGAKDFINGQAASLMECEDDHIFPKSRLRHEKVNSILNRTIISAKSNQEKGNKMPSEYLRLFLSGHANDEVRLCQTLQSHLISPEAYEALKRDDFDAFIEARRKTFLQAVQSRLEL